MSMDRNSSSLRDHKSDWCVDIVKVAWPASRVMERVLERMAPTISAI